MKKKHLFIFILIFALINTSCNYENKKETTKQDSTSIKCSKCNANIPKDSNYCNSCGEQVKKENASTKKIEKDEKQEKTKEIIKEEKPKVSGYDAKKTVLDANEYVTLFDVNKLGLKGDRKFELQRDYKTDRYTGIKKKWYTNDFDQYRIPFIREDSEYIKKVNKEIQDFIKKSPPKYNTVDYDAYVYNGILSVIIRYDFSTDNVVKSYNFDVSSGKIKYISTEKLIEKIGLKKKRIIYSIKVHMNLYLDHYIMKYQGNKNVTEEKKSEVIKYVLDNFNKLYKNNDLLIYKAKTNENYELQLPYDKKILNLPGDFKLLTLGKNSLQMAMLSRPPDAIGLICTSTNMRFPKQDRYGRDIIIHKLNDKKKGQPIYIIPFSEENNYVSITDIKFITPSKEEASGYFPKRILNDKLKLPKTDKADIYMYHTLVPEGMPNEAISIDTGLEGTSMQKPISYNGRYGYGIEYIYGSARLSKFSYGSPSSIIIEFNEGRRFKTKGDWKSIGVPITKGYYSNDSKYVYLFPSKTDRKSGADYYYILKIIKPNQYEFVYKSKTGKMKLKKKLWKVIK